MGSTALVTGASRGIGAAVARELARRGIQVFINYREKASRAERVAREIRTAGGEAVLVQADLTRPSDVRRMVDRIGEATTALDLLVLNASGGLEQGRDPEYAEEINVAAQVRLVRSLTPLLRTGSAIVYVTSHWAHRYGQMQTLPEYEAVARSKHLGESALREHVQPLRDRGIGFRVVSGDLIAGTATALLMERAHPGLLAAYEERVGSLSTVAGFALAVADVCTTDSASDVTLVGRVDLVDEAMVSALNIGVVDGAS